MFQLPGFSQKRLSGVFADHLQADPQEEEEEEADEPSAGRGLDGKCGKALMTDW